MRILHATTFLQGGAGRVITALAIAQHRAGADVRIVADAGGEPGYGSYPEYLDALDAAGVPVITVTSLFRRSAALQQRAAMEIVKAMGTWCPDVIHAHAAVPAQTSRAVWPAAPIVQTMHGWGVRKTAEQSQHDIAVMERAHVLVTPSHAAADMLRMAGLARTARVIPYGIPDGHGAVIDPEDIDLLRGLRAARCHVALCIGTIGERKNQRLLIDALPANAHAVFVGDGDAASLIAHAAERGVSNRVHVLGYRRDASRYLPWADALVLPSRNEGLPIVVLEACRQGLPVIASDVPELRESLDGGRLGALFHADDVAALGDALTRVFDASCRSRFDTAAARRAWFSTHYLEGVMVNRYATCYYAAVRAANNRRTCSVAAAQVA